MRRFSFRRGLMFAACILLSAALLAGCAAPAGPGGLPTPSETAAPAVGSALDDGRLRIFVASTNSSVTLFCGATPIYTSGPNSTVSLLRNVGKNMGDTYFSVGAPYGSHAYGYAIYDNTGALVYDGGPGSTILGAANGWVLMASTNSPDDTLGTLTNCRLLRLADGYTTLVPAGVDDLQAISPDALCLSHHNWWHAQDDPANSPDFAIFYDNDLNELGRIEGESMDYATDLPEGWLSCNSNTTTTATLYQFATGRRIPNFLFSCGTRYVCCQAADGVRYDIVDIDRGETICTLDDFCSWYAAGMAFCWNYDAPGPYYCTLQRADGTTVPARQISTLAQDYVYILLENTLECYSHDGVFQYSVAVDIPAETETRRVGTNLSAILPDRHFMLDVSTCDFDPESGTETWASSTRIYGADGLQFDAAAYTETDGFLRALYSDISTVSSGYLYGMRHTNGINQIDLLAPDGTPLLTDLAYLEEIDGVFQVRRGFTEGWMDADGNWLWQRSLWQSPNDEGL